jgi:hypothetical protein
MRARRWIVLGFAERIGDKPGPNIITLERLGCHDVVLLVIDYYRYES